MWRMPAASASGSGIRHRAIVPGQHKNEPTRHISRLGERGLQTSTRRFRLQEARAGFAEGVEELTGLFALPETPAAELIELVEILQLKLELEGGSRYPPRERDE